MRPVISGKKRAHLDAVRRLVVRTSFASVILRAWSVLVVGALSAVAADPAHARFAWLAVFVAIAFWMVDAHFLRRARLFRRAHDRIERLPDDEIDFSLDTSLVDGEKEAFRSVVFSTAITAFYVALLAAIVVVRLGLRVRP